MAGQNVGSSNLRLARSQMDQLEADLWTWRNKCKASGKKIPKRLVQARAKWAFQKQGIPDFKVTFTESIFYLIKSQECIVQTLFLAPNQKQKSPFYQPEAENGKAEAAFVGKVLGLKFDTHCANILYGEVCKR